MEPCTVVCLAAYSPTHHKEETEWWLLHTWLEWFVHVLTHTPAICPRTNCTIIIVKLQQDTLAPVKNLSFLLSLSLSFLLLLLLSLSLSLSLIELSQSWRSSDPGQPCPWSIWKCQDHQEWQLISFCKYLLITKSEYAIIIIISPQGKFIRVHFGPQGKIAGADIEYCKLILLTTTCWDLSMWMWRPLPVTVTQLRMRNIARVPCSYVHV